MIWMYVLGPATTEGGDKFYNKSVEQTPTKGEPRNFFHVSQSLKLKD